MVGVAEVTIEVASAQAQEYGWSACMVPLALQRVEYLVDFQFACVLIGLFLNVRGHIAFAFPDIHAVASVDLVAYPSSDVFGSGIEREQFVEIAVVEIGSYALFDVREICHHPVGIELACPAVDSHKPVVSVHAAAFARIGKFQTVAPCEFKCLCDVIHCVIYRLYYGMFLCVPECGLPESDRCQLLCGT